MERHETEAMTELKLYGDASFDEIAGKGLTHVMRSIRSLPA